MGASTHESLTIGFLTVVQLEDGGHLGGYLLLNDVARPVEFHCTAPVRANRAQQVLYGPTLRPYLCGEQIAGTLLAQSKRSVLFVCTDDADVLAARTTSTMPLVRIVGPSETALPDFQLGDHRATTASRHADDRELLTTLWERHRLQLDLSEPFDRIRQALQEAQDQAS